MHIFFKNINSGVLNADYRMKPLRISGFYLKCRGVVCIL